MPTRRDQVQSYQFMMQRVMSAFAHQDTDPVHPAGRRLLGAGLAGVMVAALGLAGMGVYGMLRPGGNKTWRDGSAVIVEKQSGTRYVYRDGTLYPMANLTSAVLALDGPAKTVGVAANSLLGVPRGPLLGIVGAPDALPPAARVTAKPWQLCGLPPQAGDRPHGFTSLRIGVDSTGRELGDDALLVENADSRRLFLIWHGRRHELMDRRVALTALGLDQQPAIVVPRAWLDALPAGGPLTTRTVIGRGQPATAVSGALVGQVYVVDGTSQQYYLVAEANRLAAITPVEARMLLADQATRAAYPTGLVRALTLTSMQAAAAEKQPPPDHDPAAPPAVAPPIVTPDLARFAICATFGNPVDPPRLTIDPATAQTGPATTTGRSAQGAALVDRVEVPPGWAALVEAMPSPDAAAGTRYLVSDLGIRHALADQDVQRRLGYESAAPVRLPAGLVARIPEGPVLDPAAARRPALP
ncbi:type VII secretion protein EccB [Micromonospora polyrhachis]|uniref:Type VII secretion protein EccB n=1 Tax=Micromonospora polyrhachis TaxID=1282883 RepID=A0A7W7SSM8_9ACTN|nr:type VII secretion protein EccB [Micromonospora polyrhachis]MBB4960235.1 type VII secretion protein EccB [Micromonospora polyrhachis]